MGTFECNTPACARPPLHSFFGHLIVPAVAGYCALQIVRHALFTMRCKLCTATLYALFRHALYSYCSDPNIAPQPHLRGCPCAQSWPQCASQQQQNWRVSFSLNLRLTASFTSCYRSRLHTLPNAQIRQASVRQAPCPPPRRSLCAGGAGREPCDEEDASRTPLGG